MELTYGLTDAGYTIYHRAALGGLAATIEAWKSSEMPMGIDAVLDRDEVRISWDSSSLSDSDALRRILAASFRVTTDYMIDLPGLAIPDSRLGLRLALHNGLCGTFLQHFQMRPGPGGAKGPRQISIRDADDAVAISSYLPVARYAHQKAQGTGLLDGKHDTFPRTAFVPQSIVPGSLKGAGEITVSAQDAILLLFLIVGCTVFILRPRNEDPRARFCVVVPDVANLRSFASALRRLAQAPHEVARFTNTYLGRVVGGSEEAALKFQLDLAAENVTSSRPAVRCCIAIAMGKVPWDRNQINRSALVPVGAEYDEMALFRTAAEAGKAKFVPTKTGDAFAVPATPLPELIAANFASQRHWSAHFRDLVSTKADFRNMNYLHGGLLKMKEAIRNDTDHVIIDVFHEAWKRSMANIYGEARGTRTDPERKIDVMRERIRNEILRAKTQNQLSGWLLDFCARATGGGSLSTIRQHREEIHSFLFNPKNFDRLQNLCLFALLSYAGKDPKEMQKEMTPDGN